MYRPAFDNLFIRQIVRRSQLYARQSLPTLVARALLGHFNDPQIAERQVRGWVVTLNRKRAGFLPHALARIGVWFSRVGPIANGKAVNPTRHVWAIDHQCHRKPLVIVGHHASRILASIETARSTIDGLAAISLLVAILNLELIALLEIAWDGAKENARVEMLTVRNRF